MAIVFVVLMYFLFTRFGKEQRLVRRLERRKRNMTFCKKCGEYIMSDGECSNPWCPVQMN